MRVQACVATDAPPSLARLSILTSAAGKRYPPHLHPEQQQQHPHHGSGEGSPNAAGTNLPYRTLYSALSTAPADIAVRELTYAAAMYQKEEDVRNAAPPLTSPTPLQGIRCNPIKAASPPGQQQAPGSEPQHSQNRSSSSGSPQDPTYNTSSTLPSPTAVYDSLYGHGLVLQELASRAGPGSQEQVECLRKVRGGRGVEGWRG